MIINHNIAALNTYNKLSTNNTNTAKALEKLSSGLKINKAGDDAAGLAISEKMRGQIRGLDMASKNANDGISLIATAEGALSETHSILQRMRELAVQAASDTNTTSDRTEMQKEIEQLKTEITRISTDTEFNTKKLLNGDAGVTATYSAAGAVLVEGNSSVVAGDHLDLTDVAKATAAEVVITAGEAGPLSIGSGGATIKINGVQISLAAGATGAQIQDALNAISSQTGVTAVYTDTAAAADYLTLTTTGTGSDAKIELSGLTQTSGTGAATDTFVDGTPGAAGVTVKFGGAAAVTAITANSYNTATGTDAVATVAGTTTGVDPTIVSGKGNVLTMHGGTWDGVEIKLDATYNSATLTTTISNNNSLRFHIGANENQNVGLSINDMSASALKVNDIDVTTQAGANAAITSINEAIQSVSAERSKLGSVQNRLEHTINNLGTSSENLSAAESRIRDVDMAKEMMNFTKSNILSQAAQAMLAQANQQPQSVLQLLQ